MTSFRKTLRLLQTCAGLATLSVASADIVVLHDIVYIDETSAYYLNAQVHDKNGKLIPTPIKYTYPGGIPTLSIQAGSIGRDRKIKPGDIQLLEPMGTPGGNTASDLLRFIAGPKDAKGNPMFYSLQFLSDTNETFDEGGNHERPVPGDVGFTPDPNAKQYYETDLEFATANWRLAGTGNPDPNSILKLKGTSGLAYIASCPDVSNGKIDDCDPGGILPFREGPIGYIFVSDVTSTPETSSLVLLATALSLGATASLKRMSAPR